ncbi:MAG: glycosyltransferase involved in cell wall biosynthesis [Lentimonas sp.]|jgi:glycosyltransferase involved in cell wall biosynthesis
MSNKPHLVMIVSRFPYPLEKGDKLRAFYQLKEFSRDFQVHLICTSEIKPKKEHIEAVKKHTESIEIHVIPKWQSYFSCLIQLLGSKPMQVAYFYSPWVKNKIARTLKKIKPDHIFCQLIRATEYVKDYHQCPKTLDYMDALSAGIERRIQLAPFYNKWLFKLEAKRLREYETKVFDYFEHRYIISNQDKKLLVHPDKDKVICSPNGVNPEFLKPHAKRTKFDLVFVGNLNYPPNIEAVKYIVQKILPLLNAKEKKYTFLAAGAQPNNELLNLSKKTDAMTLWSWVDHIEDAYLAGKTFVAPMMIGTGLQNKLLEAMALRIPCVTSKLANNALGATENKHLLIAYSAQDYCDKIEQLSNEELGLSIQNEAHQFIEENFSWQQQCGAITQQMLNA